MGFYVANEKKAVAKEPRLRRQVKTETPLKKSRLEFFSPTPSRAGFFASQPVEPHWEKRSTPTKTVSGVRYYGYRYYSPSMGRWLARDPVGEEAFLRRYLIGKNRKTVLKLDARSLDPLYLFVRNSPINNYDYLGLEEKCCPPSPPGPSPTDILESGNVAERKYFPEGGDPYGGAYRHCVSACNLVKNYGGLGGHAIRCIWDAYHENNSPDSISDKQGEDVGEKVGKGNEPCDTGCLRNYPPLSD